MDPTELAHAITAAAAALPVAAAAVKLPSFWRQQPALWFARVECAFTTAGIVNQTTHYSHVVQNLSEEIAAEVKALLITVPAQHPYDTLKEAILKACSASDDDRVRRFQALQLGDMRPSQLLRKMIDLQELGTDAPWYRTAFLDKLPTVLRLHLAGKTGDLTELADAADTLVDALRLQPNQSSVLAVQGAAGGGAAADGGEAALEAELAAVYQRFGRRPQQQQHSTQQRQLPKSTKSVVDASHCFFHQRFGDRAQKCRQPCSYKSGNAGGVR